MNDFNSQSVDAATERELTRKLGLMVVERVASEESLLFEEAAEEYFADPQGVLQPTRRDVELGINIDFVLLTPYALAVAAAVVQFLLGAVTSGIQEEVKSQIGQLVRWLLGIDPPSRLEDTPRPTPLDGEQLRQVRTVAHDKARQLRLPDEACCLLADAIVGALNGCE